MQQSRRKRKASTCSAHLYLYFRREPSSANDPANRANDKGEILMGRGKKRRTTTGASAAPLGAHSGAERNFKAQKLGLSAILDHGSLGQGEVVRLAGGDLLLDGQ